MDLEQCRTESARLGPWAYLATTRPDGRPHVVPVHPCWDGEFGGAGGPSDEDNAFLLLHVSRVVVLRSMGQAGREVWTA